MYESFFGLASKPFQLNPDPGFFFASKGHKRALAYLDYGLHQGEGFIVITGEVGAGKTTLLRGMIDRLPQDSIIANQIVSTQVEADDLLRLVAEGFGLPTAGADKSTLLTALRHYCLREHERGKRALLIIDEAQNLPASAVEELRMLSNFQVETRSLVQSFLIGQPELRDIMQAPEIGQLKQRVIASYHLGPLDETETREYIEHRLRHVGWNEDPRFEEGAFASIYSHTGGIPRRINALCDRLLLACYLASQHEVTSTLVTEIVDEMARELDPAGSVRPVGLRPLAARPATAPIVLRGRRPRLSAAAAADLDVSMQTDALSTTHALVGSDRLDDAEDRIAILESNVEALQLKLRRALRQLSLLTDDVDRQSDA